MVAASAFFLRPMGQGRWQKEAVPEDSRAFGLSRRTLLTGLATVPALLGADASGAAQTPSVDATLQHRIAQRAGVKTLVLSHLTPGIDGIEDRTWRDQAATHFTGEIVVARDLIAL